eukprot:GHVU01192116.1.p1 GENE.GHVU01192116.1~~GHVU01192116.1.p1  ORF type:complete len:110 (+),score=4.87 GHVU01192116.1:26-355(+)
MKPEHGDDEEYSRESTHAYISDEAIYQYIMYCSSPLHMSCPATGHVPVEGSTKSNLARTSRCHLGGRRCADSRIGEGEKNQRSKDANKNRKSKAHSNLELGAARNRISP